jgi:hypothetical protein
MLRDGQETGDETGEGAALWKAALAWAGSGVMGLCGHDAGPPVLPPLSVPLRLAETVRELEDLTAAKGSPVRVNWEAALGGRAALLGLQRRGRTSPNGSCRLLEASDGEVALSLPRPDDLDMLPALTCEAVEGDPWDAVARMASGAPAAEFVARARLLGLAAAGAGERPCSEGYGGSPYTVTRIGGTRPLPTGRPWTVVDLSSLWAGPLAARILAEAGAHVVKVEDAARPDGARRTPEFYSWLHAGSESAVQVDFTSETGQRRLADLVANADIVIEASRPRALQQIGLSPEQRGLEPGQVWLSITAHGRRSPARDWIGFGDDAAIAGGLSCRDSGGRTVFCGDAIADPITGLVAALAVLRSLDRGGGQLIDISLSGVSSWASGPTREQPLPVVESIGQGWVLGFEGRSVPIAETPPHLHLIEER